MNFSFGIPIESDASITPPISSLSCNFFLQESKTPAPIPSDFDVAVPFPHCCTYGSPKPTSLLRLHDKR
ncbi:hypothetical protein V6N12_042266 [Hibiscus sabdariffa]|uniref:Uncharacterized protein n=1 Tax=Hibiscus sabdariffa TaxID=183260 RepID=A0ABR2EEA5_9ROSI